MILTKDGFVPRHDFPEEYAPLNYCRSCGRDFTSLRAFDAHRVGTHEPLDRHCADPLDVGLEYRDTVMGIDRYGVPISESDRERLSALQGSALTPSEG